MPAPFAIIDDLASPGYFRFGQGATPATQEQRDLFLAIDKLLAALPRPATPAIQLVLDATRILSENWLIATANTASAKLRWEALQPIAWGIASAGKSGAFVVGANTDSRHMPGLEFTQRPGADIPDDQNELRIRVGQVLTVLQIVFWPRPERSTWPLRRLRTSTSQSGDNQNVIAADDPNVIRATEYRNQLLAIAKIGLENNPPQVRAAMQQLTELQTQIVAREAGTIKNAYMKRFLVYTIAAVVIFLLAFFALKRGGADTIFTPLVSHANVLLVLCAASFGAWLSFGMRKVVPGFGDLAALEEDRLDPPIRLVFVCGLALIITLLFVTGAVTIAIGSFETKPLDSVSAALLIGLFCGVSEQVLAGAVGKRASEFLSGVAASGAATSTAAAR